MTINLRAQSEESRYLLEMHENPDNPQNWPLLYIDQNVLGAPLEALISSDRYTAWRDHVVLAFSDETIREIMRAEGMKDRLIGNLESFHTARIYPEMERFSETGRYVCAFERPSARLLELSRNPADMRLSSVGLIHKLFGGRAGQDFVDLQREQLSGLKDYFRAELSEIEDDHLVKATTALLDSVFDLIFSISTADSETNAQFFEMNDGLTPVMHYRNQLKLDPQAINEFPPACAIEKIWQVLRLRPDLVPGITIEQFFGYADPNPITKRANTEPEKVRCIMLILNMIGYASDKKLKSDKKFVASMSDLEHSVYASLCTGVASRDSNFRRRLRAAFSHLDIQTAIYGVDFEGEFRLVEDI